MLENLKEVILNLEKSLNALVQDEEVELLKHPEYLQAMKEVVQSINQVTQTLKKLEESYSEATNRLPDRLIRKRLPDGRRCGSITKAPNKTIT